MLDFEVKSAQEIYERLRELMRRRLRRYVQKHLRPCPMNCEKAVLDRQDVVIGCAGCKSNNIDRCRRPENFVAVTAKEQLVEEWKDRFRNPEIVLREHQGEAALMWVLGVWDNFEEFINKQLPKERVHLPQRDGGDGHGQKANEVPVLPRGVSG